jgi:hypothetical protein
MRDDGSIEQVALGSRGTDCRPAEWPAGALGRLGCVGKGWTCVEENGGISRRSAVRKQPQPVERVSQSVGTLTCHLFLSRANCRLLHRGMNLRYVLLRSHEKLRLSPPNSMGNSTLDNCKLTHGLTGEHVAMAWSLLTGSRQHPPIHLSSGPLATRTG